MDETELEILNAKQHPAKPEKDCNGGVKCYLVGPLSAFPTPSFSLDCFAAMSEVRACAVEM